jgi:hypothetical protein
MKISELFEMSEQANEFAAQLPEPSEADRERAKREWEAGETTEDEDEDEE